MVKRRGSTTAAPPAARRRRAPTPAEPRGVVATPAPPREARGARRKRETRTRLLDAALVLMAEKGMEGVSINEITDAADVGFGSFYNHFESKEAIYAALLDRVFEEFAQTLTRLTEAVADPAEVIAICARHTLLRARRDTVWGHLLIREGLSPRSRGRGLGEHIRRDVQRGIAAGRFKADDPLATIVAVGGTVLAAIATEVRITTNPSKKNPTPREIARHLAFPERVATMMLRILGLSRAQATAIAQRPLPSIDGPRAR